MARRYVTPDLRAENDPDIITCHALRHAWDPIGSGDRMPEFGALLCLRCIRCGTLRYARFARHTGERIGRPSYVYPDQYHDTEGHDPAWWRMSLGDIAAAQRLLVEAPDDEVARRRTRPRRRAANG